MTVVLAVVVTVVAVEEEEEMHGALGHDSALQGYTGSRTTKANDINIINHAPGAVLISRPVDQQRRMGIELTV